MIGNDIITLICSTTQLIVMTYCTYFQVCSSAFITDNWREALVADFEYMRYYLPKTDYRFYISSHLQFIAGLCQQSIAHINDTINSFMSSSLVTSHLLSQSSFDARITNLLKQTRTNAPTVIVRTLDLIRTINHGNALLTVYGNNYRLDARQNRTSYYSTLLTKPVVYNETTACSCALHPKCLTRATFTTPDVVQIKGFYMGCVPSEALLSSTLECFFDGQCINLIRDHLPLNVSFKSSFVLNWFHWKTFRSFKQIHHRWLITT